MTRLLLLLLFLTPAHADLPTNFWSQVIRERASWATNPPPREPTDDEKLLAKAVELIDLCRKGSDYLTQSDAQRKVWARQCLDQTDPTERPIDIGPQPTGATP